MSISDHNESVSKFLIESFDEDMVRSVMDENIEIDPEFMGFVAIYDSLSKIIPKHFTVIDLGCYAAAQCFLFKDHAQYIGVDIWDGKKFSCENTVHFTEDIRSYCHRDWIDSPTTFAICSYVPSEDVRQLVRSTFSNVFVFFPSANKSCTFPIR